MNLRLALLGTAAMLLALPASAQNASIEGRVVKLEKEMKAVQRQVYPNGVDKFIEPDIAMPDTTQPTPTSTTAIADLLSRVDALETQLVTLTGQVEQQGNDMRSLETRLKAMENQIAKSATSPDLIPAGSAATPSPTKPATPATAKPSAARTAAVAAIQRPNTGDAYEDGYTYGYRLWEAKFYPEAQVQLQETVDKFPKHGRISYARNLLGRAWLEDNKPATAVKIFYDNYKNDPRGDRAPESLFFLGSALTDLGKNSEACEAFGQLTTAYSAETRARLAAKLAEGRARAKCK